MDERDDQIKTVADINPQVIFISYGMNDVIATNGDTDLFIKEYKAVIDQLRKKLPDTTLYVNSIFPVSAAKQEEKPVFQKIPEYNAALQKMCDENQIAFLDNTSLVSDTYYEEDGSDRCLRGTVTDFHQRQYEELCCGREKSRGISGYEGYEKSRSAGAEALLWAQQCRL